MPFQKGNTLGKENVGNKNSGRKSSYQEQADAKLLYEMFFGKQKKGKILAQIKKGNYSLKDKFVELAYRGNERILSEVFKKLFPDKFEGELKKPVNIIITRGEDTLRTNEEDNNKTSGGDRKKET